MEALPEGGLVRTHTASDGYARRYRLYPAAGRERGHVVCLHGIRSHGGWYDYSCRRLAEAGYTVCFPDRRGSGLNDCFRGDAPSFRRLLDDEGEFLRWRREAGCRPLFLLAVSWGGKLAVGLQRRHPGLADGVVLVAPGLCPKIAPPLRQRLAVLAARLAAPAKRFPIPLNDPELFTATPKWVDFIRDDPLGLRAATARFLVASAALDVYNGLAARRVAAPVLLLLAGQDRILDNARTRAFLEGFVSKDKEVIEYPHAQHTLEFEPDPGRYVADVLAWLEKRCQECSVENPERRGRG